MYANPDKVVDRAYDYRLRAPTKNTTMNVESRWSTNGTVENKTWTNKDFPSEHSNTSQGRGGGRQEAKFMEIDGVVREVADNSALTIKRRENGDMGMGDKIKNQLEAFEGEKNGMNEVIAFDSKRKRVEGKVRQENKEEKNILSLENKIDVGSKNGSVAGTGLQARQTL